jgi:NAD+ diphosphatase
MRSRAGLWPQVTVSLVDDEDIGAMTSIDTIMKFSGNPLNRVSNERRDAEWIEGLRHDPNSRFTPLHRLKFLIDGSAGALHWGNARWVDVRDVTAASDADLPEPILLGVEDGVAHFAFDASALDDPIETYGLSGVASFHDLRSAVPMLTDIDAGIGAQARSLVDWHLRHQFCAVCGAPTTPRAGGTSRKCQACGAEHFPRVDPVAIAVVTRGDHCLLGRSGRFQGNMYSALAGFIEPGESIEEAVRREVLEESGIEVGDVEYFASQPWPFPSSLMIGCIAEGLSEEITIDEEELQDVRWFSRDAIRAALAGDTAELSVPQPLAIAHHLVKEWAGRG